VSKTEAASSTVRLAIVGAADWLRRYHLPAIQRLEGETGLTISGIWNRTREKAERLAQEYSLPRVYNTLDQLLEDPDIDAIVCVVNRYAAFDMISKLATKGVPLLTEKPPADTARRAAELARTVKVPNLVAFNRRYAPFHHTFCDQLPPRQEIAYFQADLFRRRRDDPSFVLETGVHAIDFAHFVCGPIGELNTVDHTAGAAGAADRVCLCRFDCGVIGVLRFFPYSPLGEECYETRGKGWSVRLSSAQAYTHTERSVVDVVRESSESGIVSHSIAESDPDRLSTSGYLELYREFAGVVRGTSDARSTLQTAAAAMEMAEKIMATSTDPPGID